MPFPLEEYERIAATLSSLKGRAIVSLNDHPEMRRVFAGFPIETVDITYTIGGGEKAADRRELVIFSWDPVEGGGGGLF